MRHVLSITISNITLCNVFYVVDTYITYLELGLDLPQLAPGEHLDVRRDLLPRPRLARPQLDVARYQLVPPCRQKDYRISYKTSELRVNLKSISFRGQINLN